MLHFYSFPSNPLKPSGYFM